MLLLPPNKEVDEEERPMEEGVPEAVNAVEEALKAAEDLINPATLPTPISEEEVAVRAEVLEVVVAEDAVEQLQTHRANTMIKKTKK